MKYHPFMCGALIYKEPLDEGKIIGFVFIWAALVPKFTTGHPYPVALARVKL